MWFRTALKGVIHKIHNIPGRYITALIHIAHEIGWTGIHHNRWCIPKYRKSNSLAIPYGQVVRWRNLNVSKRNVAGVQRLNDNAAQFCGPDPIDTAAADAANPQGIRISCLFICDEQSAGELKYIGLWGREELLILNHGAQYVPTCKI